MMGNTYEKMQMAQLAKEMISRRENYRDILRITGLHENTVRRYIRDRYGHDPYYPGKRQIMPKKTETLCWWCKNAVCGCVWSRFFLPVPGWVADPTEINSPDKSEPNKKVPSYNVRECPQFKEDTR